MDLLTWVFLESLVALGVVLGLALFGLLVVWRRSLNPRPLLIGLAIAAILLFVQKAVVTQREHAGRILDAIQTDLLASRPDAIERSLSDPFVAGFMDRAEFLDVVRTQLRKVRILQLSRGGLRVTRRAPGTFQVQASFSSRIDSTEYGATLFPTTWSLDFVNSSEGWRISRIEPLAIGSLSQTSWTAYGGR